MTLLHISAYISFVVFIIMVIARAVRIARMPVHLRWELYPVPHEKGRAHYGGSRLEEVDWWTKPSEKDHIGELAVMIPEILFLKAVWEHNRPLWFGSFTLHFGLYLLIANMFLMLLSAVLSFLGLPLQTDSQIGGLFFGTVTVLAWAGCVIGGIGAIVLLFKRIFEHNLSSFSTVSHYFNLVILGIIYLSGILWLSTSTDYAVTMSGIYFGLLSAGDIPALSTTALVSTISSLFFILYLPFTHMTHFFTKYFTYHTVRWEDEPNMPGHSIQEKVNGQLAQTVSWSAEHIGADGKKNWVDLALEDGSIKTKVEESQ